MVFIYTLASVVLVSLISLIGVLTLAVKKNFINNILLYLVAFSVGALLGDSLIHLLPEAFSENGESLFLSLAIFSGMLSFFLLEKILRWRHCHDLSCKDHPNHIGTINLVGDALHNLIDGLLIGASFLVSVPLGIATTLAVILHEIPQELGDFGVLIHSGFTVKKAVLYNFISASTAIISAMVAVWIGTSIIGFERFMIPFTIGSFVYIALSDLIPELHQEVGRRKTLGQIIAILLGFGVMYAILFIE